LGNLSGVTYDHFNPVDYIRVKEFVVKKEKEVKRLDNRNILSDKEADFQGIPLVDCPFCGGNNLVVKKITAWRIWCDSCGARGVPSKSAYDAVYHWNNRISDLDTSIPIPYDIYRRIFTFFLMPQAVDQEGGRVMAGEQDWVEITEALGSIHYPEYNEGEDIPLPQHVYFETEDGGIDFSRVEVDTQSWVIEGDIMSDAFKAITQEIQRMTLNRYPSDASLAGFGLELMRVTGNIPIFYGAEGGITLLDTVRQLASLSIACMLQHGIVPPRLPVAPQEQNLNES
jgi:hypothetical protein